MPNNRTLTAIGLMSGTSLDGIDAAIIYTDGITIDAVKSNHSYEYDISTRNEIKQLINGKGNRQEIEKKITIIHANVVKNLLSEAGITNKDIDIIGFHGQTIKHDPENGITIQIGDGKLLSELTGINVVNDLRSNDVKHGGQGAPLVPLYHAALVQNEELPVAIVNIGGVGNVTWVGKNDNILAFDTGPGNALIDDWVLEHKGISYDKSGEIALTGTVNKKILQQLLESPYFEKPPPKSLDRNHFANKLLSGLSIEDGAATLTAFTIKSITRALEHFPSSPNKWYITGGGRHNNYIMNGLSNELSSPVRKIEELGYNGDMLEAEAFGFLAVRSLYNMPLTLPSTTGIKEALSGGDLFIISAI